MNGGPYGRGKAPKRACLKLEHWPALDRDLWMAAFAPTDLFELGKHDFDLSFENQRNDDSNCDDSFDAPPVTTFLSFKTTSKCKFLNYNAEIHLKDKGYWKFVCLFYAISVK